MSEIQVRVINRSRHPLPEYYTEHAAAFDVRANIDEPVTLGTLERAVLPTGLFMAIPPGYEIQLRPRSGLAAKHGISLLNAPGTIDADYRGELGVIVVNLSNEPYTFTDGERVAQIVIAKADRVVWQEVDELEETSRGAGGFGHTGKI
jgi:dUTP pyrophosphatase